MHKRFLAFLAIALLAFGFGCQNTSIAPADAPGQVIDLDSPTGGFSTSDEQPAFGETDKFAAFTDETAISDPLARNAAYEDDTLIARGARLIAFRAIWGYLANRCDTAAPDPCPLDWSGSLHLEGGIIIMQKAIAFEPNDSMMRVDESTIEWISHTGPRFDGIQVKLIIPARDDSSDCVTCEPKLELSTGPYSRTFTVDELVALSIVEPVDTCGNAISISSVLAPPLCPHGQLMGSWEKTVADSLAPSDTIPAGGTVAGIFRGTWIGMHGLIGGHLKGVFGLNSSGEPVFFGKYIDLDGHFVGILRGTYGERPELANDSEHCRGRRHRRHDPRGWFVGEWIDENYDVQGRLRGHWTAADDSTSAGFFHGIWGMRCSEGTDGDINRGRDRDKNN